MDKKQLAAIILSLVTVWLVIFIAVDLWNSIKSASESKRAAEINRPQGSKQESGQKIPVVASIYPVYFFAQQIAGAKANVIDITPAGTNPGEYHLTSQDITAIEKSKIVILNGLGIETWQNDAKNLAASSNSVFVVASDGLLQNDIITNESSFSNPYTWLSAQLAEKMIDEILDGFIKADAQNADYYKANAKELKQKISELDQEFKDAFAACKSKEVAVFSEDFQYLFRNYNLTQTSISGIFSNNLSSQQINSIADFVKSKKIDYVYFDNSFDKNNDSSIQEKIGAKILILDQIDVLTSQDYFSRMRNNLTNLKTGLDCQ